MIFLKHILSEIRFPDSPARRVISDIDVPDHVWVDLMPYSPDTVSIESLYIDPEYRGSGLGKQFMDNLTSLADHHGTALELEVGGYDNEFDLVRWYEKYGFKHINGFWRRLPKK